MVKLIAIVVSLGISVFMWKIVGPKIQVPKAKVWGLSVGAGVLVGLLFAAYFLHMLNDPFTYIVAIPLTVMAYSYNEKYYQEKKEKK